ncbi:hypothetical protein [Chitinivorax sp. B]|uniref:hypothetical protein n=1 Tax=Chitinivorax sp. B TaxID=2502235 RepID=UPI0010F9D66B|nr:hypothetical protein [Chitinivorax sp. B]
MKTELNELEAKIHQLASLCQHLRQENNELRQALEMSQEENRRLNDKVDGAKMRIEQLLQSMPETPAE